MTAHTVETDSLDPTLQKETTPDWLFSDPLKPVLDKKVKGSLK